MGTAKTKHYQSHSHRYVTSMQSAVIGVIGVSIIALRSTGLIGQANSVPVNGPATTVSTVTDASNGIMTIVTTDSSGRTVTTTQQTPNPQATTNTPRSTKKPASTAPGSTTDPQSDDTTSVLDTPGPTSPDPEPNTEPNTETTPDPTPTPPPPAPTPPPPPAPTYTYRNGTYYTESSFSTPGGTERIGISLTINNDVITGTSATKLATNPTSKSYENSFVSNYASSVVGRPLAGLSLSKIAGASLTTGGFNTAANVIRSMAD